MPNRWFGFNPPFLGGAQNVMSPQQDERLIKNDILQILLTIPGERVMRPDFGTPLRAYPFELLDSPAELDTLSETIKSQITKYEERVIVNSVTVVPSTLDDHALVVSVVVSPNGQPLINYLVQVQVNTTFTTVKGGN